MLDVKTDDNRLQDRLLTLRRSHMRGCSSSAGNKSDELDELHVVGQIATCARLNECYKGIEEMVGRWKVEVESRQKSGWKQGNKGIRARVGSWMRRRRWRAMGEGVGRQQTAKTSQGRGVHLGRVTAPVAWGECVRCVYDCLPFSLIG